VNKYLEKHGVVAFIDVLGYSSIIDAASKYPCILGELEESLVMAIKLTNILGEFIQNVEPSDRFINRQFSDSVIISYEYPEGSDRIDLACWMVFLASATYQYFMLRHGFYVRGGIASGFWYINDSNNIIFSKGLTKAYVLESTLAIYPRIIVEPGLIQTIKESDFAQKTFPALLVEDWSGKMFINYFGLYDVYGRYEDRLKNSPDMPNLVDILRFTMASMPDTLAELGVSKPITVEEIAGMLPEAMKQWDVTDPTVSAEINAQLHAKLSEFRDDDKLREKYLWLIEFFNWATQKGGGLNFKRGFA